jgi:serine/arginine repetitive matrix protein 2
MPTSPGELRPSRERALTLESKYDDDAPHGMMDPAWRASTGRNDLSRRQLLLLRDMLHGTEALAPVTPPDDPPRSEAEQPSNLNRAWRWGDPMGSTITLPSDEGPPVEGGSPLRKRQSGMKLGMRGLRDMLKSLKKSQQREASAAQSSPSPQADSPHPASGTSTRPRSKTSSAAPSVRSTNVPPVTSPGASGTITSTLGHKPSPRRPSLASIFRLGQRHRSGGGPAPGASSDAVASSAGARTASGSSRPSSTSSEEDWDRIDSASDVDATAGLGLRIEGAGTVRVPSGAHKRSPYAPSRNSADRSPTTRRPPPPAASRSSIFTDGNSSAHSHGRKLSNVEEQVGALATQVVSRRASVRSNRNGSVRLPNPPPVQPMSIRTRSAQNGALPDPQLAMTPENIRPLLENAREVQSRLVECVDEVRGLLAAHS